MGKKAFRFLLFVSTLLIILLLQKYLDHENIGVNLLSIFREQNIIHAPSFIRIVDFQDQPSEPLPCTETTTVPKFFVCTHPRSRDVWISKSLIVDGVWEAHITKLFQAALRTHPAAAAVDIGANIGYYSLLAGAMGRKVVAVEPKSENVLRFKRSAYMNGLTQNITLLHNAVADKHTKVSLTTSSDNQGDLRVLENSNSSDIPTIIFDDLLSLINTNLSIIIMDVQGYECHARRSSKKFFQSVYVPYIFMEWDLLFSQRNQANSPCPLAALIEMIDFLVKQGYLAHNVGNGVLLNSNDSTRNWTMHDIYWRRNEQPILKP